MNGWLEYEYVIATQPDQCEFPALNDLIMSRIEMSPRRCFISMHETHGLLIFMDDMKGLSLTDDPNLFEFTGSRPHFDDWMAEHHADIGYCGPVRAALSVRRWPVVWLHAL